MPSTKNLKQTVGQLFLVGFDGYSVPNEFRKAISEYHLSGTIYFKRNVQSPAQLAELSNDLQFSCRPKDVPPLFISIDHEGGKVNRLVKPFTKFPGNDYLGELDSPKISYDFGMVLGKELAAVGINVNYAPVVDVYTNPQNTVIKNRAFGADPELCARLGSAVSRGLQKMGVMAVAKHFPGHGGVKEDSHFALPKLTRTVEELESLEWIPFRRVIRSRVEGIMTAHILNDAIDPDYPATLSKKTIGILREKLRFSKLIFSDDLDMKAIADHYTAEKAPVLAIAAGCDQLIYRGDAGVPIAAIEAVIHAVEKKEIPREVLDQAYARVQSSKATYASAKSPVDVTEVGNFIGLPEHFQLADIITKKERPPAEPVGTDYT